MFCQKRLYLRGLVCRQIVEDDVDFLFRFTATDDLLQKAHELLTGMPWSGFPLHLARPHIQGSVQRKRSVPIVFEPMAFDAARRHRQNRVEPIQGLNGRLLIYAEDCCVLWRCQIKSNDVSGLPLEIGVITAIYRSSLCGFRPALY